MKKRELKYENIRVISMLFILFIHELNTILVPGSLVHNISSTILLTGVPMFLMLSGRFAFNIDYKDKNYLKKYYINKLIKLVIPVLVYFAIKEFHVMYYNLGKEITVYSYLRSLIVSIFNGYYYMEYWFIYVLIGNLLIVPFVGKFIKGANKKEANIFLAIAFFVNLISTALSYKELSFNLPYAFAGRNLYFYLGYFLDKFHEKDSKKMYILGLVSFPVTLLLIKFNIAKDIWSYAPTYVFIACAMYMFIKEKMKTKKMEKIVLFLGKNSLAVYMLHMIFIYTYNDLLDLIFKNGGVNPLIRLVIVTTSSLVSSIIAGVILDKTIIKWFQKLITTIIEQTEKLRKRKCE